MASSPQKSFLSNTAIFVESRIFPIFFIICSLRHFNALAAQYDVSIDGFASPSQTYLMRFISLSDMLIILALALFNFLIAYALIISRNLRVKPEGSLEVIVPLAATFWYLVYNLVPYLPKGQNILVIPEALLPVSVCAGVVLALTGLAIASRAIFDLRKSFGIFVQVRDIITKGLYRHVRHPIYCGHILSHFGFFFIMPRLYPLILTILLASLTVYRAKLEEAKLMSHSKDYVDYAQKTPFLFPFRIKMQ